MTPKVSFSYWDISHESFLLQKKSPPVHFKINNSEIINISFSSLYKPTENFDIVHSLHPIPSRRWPYHTAWKRTHRSKLDIFIVKSFRMLLRGWGVGGGGCTHFGLPRLVLLKMTFQQAKTVPLILMQLFCRTYHPFLSSSALNEMIDCG